MTALENVALPLELAGDRDAFAAAAALLREVGLERPRRPLSGPALRRRAAARGAGAGAGQPAAPAARRRAHRQSRRRHRQGVVDLIFAACAARGMTLLLITHDAGLAPRCQRRLTMDRGRLGEPARRTRPDGRDIVTGRLPAAWLLALRLGLRDLRGTGRSFAVLLGGADAGRGDHRRRRHPEPGRADGARARRARAARRRRRARAGQRADPGGGSRAARCRRAGASAGSSAPTRWPAPAGATSASA